MNMKPVGMLMIAAVAVAFCMPFSSCSESEDKTCDQYCEALIYETNDCWDYYYGCEIEDDAMDKYIDECAQECEEALGEISSEEKGEAKACIQCVWDEVGAEPECGEIYESVVNDCDDECNDDGMEEYNDEFDTVNVDDDDIDC